MGPPPQELVERFLARPISRRDIGKGAIAGLTGVGVNLLLPTVEEGIILADCYIENNIRSFPDATLDLKSYDEGFIADQERKLAMINSANTETVPLLPSNVTLSDGILFDGRFRLDTPAYIILQINGTKTPFKHLQVLDVRLNDGVNPEEEYYHPILDTEKDKKATTSFHERLPGEYRVTVGETAYSYGINSDDLDPQIKIITTEDPLFHSIIRRCMKVRLRADNLKNIVRNMPVRSRWGISENEKRKGVFLVKYSQDLIGQNGGTDVCRAKHPDDEETYAMDLFTPEGFLLDQVGQEGVHHRKTTYPLARIPCEVTGDMAIDVVILTQNNIPTRDTRYFTKKIVASFDEYLPMDEEIAEQRTIALKTNAYQEWWARGELSKKSDEVNRFIKEKLNGVDIIRT